MAFETLFSKYDRLVLFDTETTGLLFNRDEIIEFAAVVVEQKEGELVVTQEYDELISLSPGMTVPPEIEKLTGTKFTQVPYPGGGKAMPALKSGEVDCYFGSTSNYLRMEGVRGLALASQERYELAKNIPTFTELGYPLLSAKYRGIATPPNFPKEAQEYLEAKLAEIYKNPEYLKAVRGAGLTPYFTTGKEFADIIDRETKKAADILKSYGVLK